MTDLEKVLYYIQEFLNNKIDVDTFCDKFTVFFAQEADYDTLTKKEYQILKDLEDTTSRYSPFEEEFSLYPYKGEEEVRKKVQQVLDALNS